MMWTYVEFPDETTVAYSDMLDDGTIRINIERPVDWGFDSAQCELPSLTWKEVSGFSDAEIESFTTFLKNNSPLIYEFALNPDERLAVA